MYSEIEKYGLYQRCTNTAYPQNMHTEVYFVLLLFLLLFYNVLVDLCDALRHINEGYWMGLG